MRFDELSLHAQSAAGEGREVVAVLGMGFVGTAVCASLVQASRDGRAPLFVLAVDRDDERGRPRVERLERGEAPVEVGDVKIANALAAGLREPRVLAGSVDARALSLADVVVVCINLDLQRESGQTAQVSCDLEGYAETMRSIGRVIRPGTLVLIESTMPVGASERVLRPALCEGLRSQGVDVEADPPLFGYSYERVMPGPLCLESVHEMWRSFGGFDEASASRTEAFLRSLVDTERFPLHRHKSIRAAELAKLMENAYRATNIAFIEEWARLAEDVDVDLFDVIESIRRRRGTHDNMMRPGLGVGGQCVTKDALLAAFGARELFDVDTELPFSHLAILTNERMPLRAVDRAREHFHGDVAGRRALVVGITYLPGVADTRSSPAATVARALLAAGADVRAIDATVTSWPELPEVEVSAPPVAGGANGANGAVGALGSPQDAFDLVVLCLPDPANRELLAHLNGQVLHTGALVVDPWNTLGDATIADLAGAGVTVAVYGRGDLPEVPPRDPRA